MLCAVNISQAQAGSVIVSNYSKFQTWSNNAHSKTPDGKVKVVIAYCPGNPDVSGCTVNSTIPTIYLPYGLTDLPWVKDVFYHELGHVYDFVHNDSDRRTILKTMLGFSTSTGWWTSNLPECFAEAARTCYLGYEPYYWYGYNLPYSSTLEICRFMNRVESDGGSGSQG